MLIKLSDSIAFTFMAWYSVMKFRSERSIKRNGERPLNHSTFFPKKKKSKEKTIYLFFRSFFDWVSSFRPRMMKEKKKTFSFFWLFIHREKKSAFWVDCVVCVYTRKNKWLSRPTVSHLVVASIIKRSRTDLEKQKYLFFVLSFFPCFCNWRLMVIFLFRLEDFVIPLSIIHIGYTISFDIFFSPEIIIIYFLRHAMGRFE